MNYELKKVCAALGLRVEVVETTGSTNVDVRARAERGEPGGLAIVARRQTGGRGRRGRSFFSPATGAYMSLLLRPDSIPASGSARYTTVAALAVCETIEATTGKEPRIKWVNDVFVGGRKVCGILTEAQVARESGLLEYVVIGIGANLYAPESGYPEELTGIAGAIYDERQEEGFERFIVALLTRLTARLETADAFGELAAYRRRLLAQGRPGVVTTATGDRREVKLLDVDSEYRLIVEELDGTRSALSSGEVSVRPTDLDA